MLAHWFSTAPVLLLWLIWGFAVVQGTEHVSDARLRLNKRALDASVNGYAPSRTECPAVEPVIRAPHGLSEQEAQWAKKRKTNVRAPMRDLLGRMSISDFNAGAYIDSLSDDQLPTISLAMSGGGYRAMLVGAGALAAFDDRTSGSKQPGHIGGLLQSSTYISGLSGGGWLVGSIFVNNFTHVEDIINGEEDGRHAIWNFERSMLEGPKTSRIPGMSLVNYWRNIYSQVIGKKDARFDTSVTDWWSRGLAYQMIKANNGGPGYTWSSIAEQPGFPDAQSPMPFLVACNRSPGEILVSRNTTVFEFSPWEMGSWDPTLFAMAPIKYVGSDFHGGVIKDKKCVTGFDNAAFVMGTSSSLFNAVVAEVVGKQVTGVFAIVMDWIKDLVEKLNKSDNDIASWTPNPFHEFNPRINQNSVKNQLSLVDGGEDYQNIPFYPHIQPPRKVDVVFAVDSSADTGSMNGWPNGTAIVATYDRHDDLKMANRTIFPAVPDVNTFVNKGLNAKPTFFGCDVKNLTYPAPLIVYIPNHPYTFYTNISTSTSTIDNKLRDKIIRNGYHVATMGNGTIEPEWPACVGCAMLSRSFDRTNTPVPPICQQCFKKHCWDGTYDSTQPQTKYKPELAMPQAASGETMLKKHKSRSGATFGKRYDGGVVLLALVASVVIML